MKNVPPDFSSGANAGSPLGFLQSLLGSIRPPDWMVDELQNRVVLFLNHVLMSEPQALERLKRQQGKPVKVVWGDFQLSLAATPAGLLERPSPDTQPQLSVTLTQTSPFTLAQTVLSGDKPAVDIQGDVQLAAEVAWLVDNVRWDVEEDLSRVFGDAVAHTLTRAASGAAQAVKGFVPRKAPSSTSGTDSGPAGGTAP